jgi:hypothetical protein
MDDCDVHVMTKDLGNDGECISEGTETIVRVLKVHLYG